jgi:hypothetical protein
MPRNIHVPARVLSAKFGYAYLDIDKTIFIKSDQEKKRLKLLKERQNHKNHKWTTAISFNCNTQ